MPIHAPERRHVFISYSHADRAWVERLKQMMAPLLRGSGQELRLWDDSQIEAGMRWREAIATALAEAKVALLLVSDDFLASEFVMGQELPLLLAAAAAEGVPVLWVSLSPSLVEETEIPSYQAVLPPHRHLEAMAEVEWKEALRTIGLAIRKALREPLAAAASQVAAVASPMEIQALRPQPESPQPLGLPTETIELETARLRRQGEGISLPLLWIPGGEFVMGSPPDELEREDDEGSQHRVRLAGIWLGQTPASGTGVLARGHGALSAGRDVAAGWQWPALLPAERGAVGILLPSRCEHALLLR